MLEKLLSVATLPGETVLAAAINAGVQHRMTMSEANRDGFDALQLEIARDAYDVWRSLVVKAGLLSKRPEAQTGGK